MIERDDLKSILRVAVHVAKVDHHFVEEERRLLGRLMGAMSISAEERQTMLGDETPLSNLVHGLSSEEARRLLVHTVCAVAAVDGYIAEVEEHFFDKVTYATGESVNMPPKDTWITFVEEVQQAFLAFGD